MENSSDIKNDPEKTSVEEFLRNVEPTSGEEIIRNIKSPSDEEFLNGVEPTVEEVLNVIEPTGEVLNVIEPTGEVLNDAELTTKEELTQDVELVSSEEYPQEFDLTSSEEFPQDLITSQDFLQDVEDTPGKQSLNDTEPEANAVSKNEDLEDLSAERPESLNLQTAVETSELSNIECKMKELKLDSNCEPVAEPSGSQASPSTPSKSLPKSEYHVKWVQWKQKKTPIITQNENGPCPLLAIINVLILKGRISIPSMIEIITAEQLMEYLGDCILTSIPKNIPEGAQLNYEQNMHDAMSVLPKLQTGLDVNVKFTGVSDFEYTPECIVFDLLHIPLYHGWLIDPQSTSVLTAVGNCSYNQLVEKIINNKTSSRSEVVTEALIAESFLEKTASQLTYHGLCELISLVKEDELCVLFRNNHFISLHKHNNELFQLVTDQGFLTESNVVWETLNNIEGDCQFVDANFVTVPPKAMAASKSNVTGEISTEQQVNQDYLVALSLQQEQQSQQRQEIEWETFKEQNLGVTENMTDEELARKLQEEEERLAVSSAPQSNQTVRQENAVSGANRQNREPSSPVRNGNRNRNSRNCQFL